MTPPSDESAAYPVPPIEDDLADAVEETPPGPAAQPDPDANAWSAAYPIPTAEDLFAAEEMNGVLPSPAEQSEQVDDESDNSFRVSDPPGNY